jgi:hypothetical protein
MGKQKLTKQIVNDRITDRGLTLIGDYVNKDTKTTFRCSHGHEWDASPGSVMGGRGCPHCGGSMKLTPAVINERLAPLGIILIGDYVNKDTKTTFRCSYGHEWVTTVKSAVDRGCPICHQQTKRVAANRLGIDEAKKRLSASGMELIGDYTLVTEPVTMKCEQGHETTSSLIAWKGRITDDNPNGCVTCNRQTSRKLFGDLIRDRLKTDRDIEMGEYLGGGVLTTFKSNVCGHTWEAKPVNVDWHGSDCSICYGTPKSSKEEVNEAIKDRGLELIGEYVSKDAHSLFKCKCGYEWMASPGAIKNNGRGCPVCCHFGFNPLSVAWLYIFERDGYIKYGITNDLKRRLSTHLVGGEYRLLFTKEYQLGEDAKLLEQKIKKTLGGRYATKEQCPDGYTETLPISRLDEVLSMINT